MSGRGAHAPSGNNGHGAAAFRVQNQIRRNAQDMQEYLTDLGSWEKSIKKKDKQISRKAGSSSRSPLSAAAAATTEAPSIRRSEGTFPVTSGPAPKANTEGGRRCRSPSRQVSAGSGDTQGQNAREGGSPSSRPRAADRAREGGEGGTADLDVSAAEHTHDKGYGKWDKFDVDAALRSVDQEDRGEADKRRAGGGSIDNSDSDTDGDNDEEAAAIAPRLTPATMVDRSSAQDPRRTPVVARASPPPPQSLSPRDPPKAAVAPAAIGGAPTSSRDREKEERDRGNAKFGRGDFEGAVKSYTRCVGMNAKIPLAYSNRAIAYIKLKEFGKAEADCGSALRVDPRHVKSLQRRAAARNALGKHRAALGDLQTAAEIDPSSKEVRKDLSKTLETLKTVVRRAPKRRVKVESLPLPAQKPRGYSPTAVVHAASAATATDRGAPVGAGEETMAPFSSVLRGNADRLSGGETVFREPRTTVEELPPDEAEFPPAPSPAPARKGEEQPAGGISLPAARIAAVSLGGRAEDIAPGSPLGEDNGSDVNGAAAVKGVGPAPPRGEAGSLDGSAVRETVTTMPTGTAVVEPSAAAQVGTAPPPTAAVAGALPSSPVGPETLTDAEVAECSQSEDHSLVDAGAKQAFEPSGRSRDIVPEIVPSTARGETRAPSVGGKPKSKRKAATARRRPTDSSAAAASSAEAARTQQLPTTGYQLEHMWRSTEGLPEARLELLRTIPPSSVSKIFRRTPLELELLSGVLRHLGEALLPQRPATALRWLKSLSKASRFGMTVALLGEGDGRADARELLARLEAAPPAKVDRGEIDTLRKQFLLS